MSIRGGRCGPQLTAILKALGDLEAAEYRRARAAMAAHRLANPTEPIRICVSTPRSLSTNIYAKLFYEDLKDADSTQPFQLYEYQKTVAREAWCATEEATIENDAATEVSPT